MRPSRSRQLGNERENRFAELLRAAGYCVFPSRGSRGVDLLAVHRSGSPILGVEVGGESKRIAVATSLLEAADLPDGAIRLVARELGSEWRVYCGGARCDIAGTIAPIL